MQLDRAKIEQLRRALPAMPLAEKARVLALLEEATARMGAAKSRTSLLDFVVRMDPTYKIGAHHRILAKNLEAMAKGTITRLGCAMAPRFGKSTLLSMYFPAWFMGNYPGQKLIIASHTADLAQDFGRKVRNLIDRIEYRAIFPEVELSKDSTAAGKWTTNSGGEFFAVGVGGALAGRGADLLIIDDPFSEQDILAGNYEVFDKVYEWYAYGARTRLMPGGRVCVLHTRWAKNDLLGRLLTEQGKKVGGDVWEYVEFPAIINEGHDNEKSLWPEQWSLEALQATRAEMPLFQWNAQYGQNPTNAEGALIKKEWWQVWTRDKAPEIEYLIMSLDPAQEAKTRADFSALTTWGVFYLDDPEDGKKKARVILLNAINKRLEYPELKDLVLREYKEWLPDCLIVEKKSNGVALYQEMRRMGVPLQEFTPSRGSDKIARVNSIADIVRSGMVYVPEYRWAEELVEQCNDFPAGANDDLVDSTVMALLRVRQGGFIRLASDFDEEPVDKLPVTRGYYRP